MIIESKRTVSRWIKSPDIAIDVDSTNDSRAALTPRVIKLPEGGFRMFYMGAGKSNAGRILSAFSKDLDIWEKESGIRIDTCSEKGIERVLSPDLVEVSRGVWRMYFEVHHFKGQRTIMSAVSNDLFSWSMEEGVRIQSKGIAHGAPKCLKMQNGKLRLFFHRYPQPFKKGIDAGNHIISAISSDGLGFVFEEGARISQEDYRTENYGVYAPEIIRSEDDSFLMFYSGWTWSKEEGYCGQILSARSKDSFHWIKDKSVVISNGGLLDSRFSSEPCLIENPKGGLTMFYEACDHLGAKRILKASQS